MTLGEIIALAKQGYKPSDIKELIELANTPTTPEKPEAPETPSEPTPNTTDRPDENVSRETQAEDIKAELETMKAELEKTKSELQAAQKENSRKGVEQPDVDTDKNIDDWIRSFM